MPARSYPRLFEPVVLAGRRLRNRVTHASMTTRLGREQQVSGPLLAYYRSRARGGERRPRLLPRGGIRSGA